MSIEYGQQQLNTYTNTIQVIDYINKNNKWYYNLKCLICNNIWDLRSDDLKRLVNNKKGGCRICSNREIASNNIKEDTLKEIQKLKLYFEITESHSKKIHSTKHFKCLKCGIEFDDQIHNLIGKLKQNYNPCSNCKYTIINNDITNQKNVLLENNILDIEILDRVTKQISQVKCLNCNHIWNSYFSNIIRAKKKWNTNSCPKCDEATGRKTSSQQIELENFIKQYYNIITSYKLPNCKEIDIFIPDLNIGIEYNGSYYHSPDKNLRIDTEYHKDKTRVAKNNDIRLIHLFSPYWINKKELCKKKLLNLIGKNKSYLRSKDYIIKSVNWNDAKEFLIENHIMGAGEIPLFSYGLFNKLNLLIGIATFTNKRKGNFRERDDEVVEFNRFATSIRCYGSMQKILKCIKQYHPYIKQIISYADLTWSNTENNIYVKNGFKLEKITEPNYWWCKNDLIIPRRNTMKHLLPNLLGNKFDPEKTEVANMLSNGYIRLWDCGHAKYILSI